jgi:hypothetical protein
MAKLVSLTFDWLQDKKQHCYSQPGIGGLQFSKHLTFLKVALWPNG